MLKWVKSLFAWRTVRDSGVWLYKANAVTGKRKAFRYANAHQPLDLDWLGDGEIIS